MQSTIARVSAEALQHAQGAVAALIGADLEFSLQSASLIKKDGYVEKLSGRQTIIGLALKGRYQGEGCLVVSEKGAVRLAGKMLMMPTTELNEIINSANYINEEEIRYAFADLAKCFIISFLEAFQRDSTFISSVSCHNQIITEGRKDITDFLNHLPAEQTYYQISANISLAGVTTNSLSLLLPSFVLVCSETFQKSGGSNVRQRVHEADDLDTEQLEVFTDHAPETAELEGADLLAARLGSALQRELGNLLGVSVQVREKKSIYGSLALLQEKTAHLEMRTLIAISGSVVNQGWLKIATEDAIKLGMLLIAGPPGVMIPDSLTDAFSVDCQDGYEEISSVFVDVLKMVIDDLSDDEIVVEKGRSLMESDAPASSEADQGERDQNCILSSVELAADNLVCGTLHLILPVELYEVLHADELSSTPENDTSTKLAAGGGVVDGAVTDNTSSGEPVTRSAQILLIESSSVQVAEMMKTLNRAGLKNESIGLDDEFGKAELDDLLAVILVVPKLDEIALGAVIKIKACASTPLLVAASQWTQSDVMKALRYGVDDILVLPVESDELLQKLKRLEQLTV